MNNKLIGGIAVIGLVLVLAVVGLFGKDKTSVTPSQTNTQETVVGSVTNNAPTEPFYFQGGFTSKTVGFVSTTTVAAAIQNTTGATTTFTARFVTIATTTTTVLNIATTTNAGRYATTTATLSNTITASTNGTASYVGANNQNILGPGEWVQVGYGAGTTLPAVAQQQTGVLSVTFVNIR